MHCCDLSGNNDLDKNYRIRNIFRSEFLNMKRIYLVLAVSVILMLNYETILSYDNIVTPTDSPAQTYQSIMSNPNLALYKGESFCWHAAYSIRTFVDGYEATQNTQWLDYGIQYYDYLVNKMDTGPDGYKGWMSRDQYNRAGYRSITQ